MTIRDIAKLAGVSVSTVSKVMNKKDSSISQETREKVLRIAKEYNYSPYASIITPREILIEALRCLAVGMVLVHNHPSGDPSPSLEDIRVTRRISKAGELLGIQLLDHVIIGDRCYSSLRERGILSDKG